MRILLAGFLGAIAMFAWTSIAHVATPLGMTGFSTLQNEPAVLTAMKDATGDKAGLYFFPGTDMNAPDAMEKAADAMKVNPSGLLLYHPAGGSDVTIRQMGTEFAKELAVTLLAAWLLSMAVISAFVMRTAFVTVIGVVATLTTNLSYWNWYGFPANFTLAAMIIDVVGFFVAGLVIAYFIRRPT